MKLQLLVSAYLFFFVFSTTSFCQEFGEISDEELQMTIFEKDPEADVVVLYDIGEIRINVSDRFDMTFDYRKRVKILTEAGKEEASIRLSCYSEESITGIEAYAYLPNGEEIELDDDNIFEEEVRNRKYYKFDIPGVEVGSVIEYKYTLYSGYVSDMKPWYFQSDAYVVLSKLDVYLANGFLFNALKSGWLPSYDIDFKSEKVFQAGSSSQIMRHTWVAINLPAIREEPYMMAEQDYYARVLFQLVSYRDRYNNMSFAKSWNDLAEGYNFEYKKKIKESGDHRDFMKKYLKDEKSDLEKAIKTYIYIKDSIKTSNANMDLDLEEVFNKKAGTVYDKNLLLCNILMHQGLCAYTFRISTRDNGQLFERWPNISQFNRTIVLVEIDGKKYFLDTANKYCPFGYLTPQLDVGIGLKMTAETAEIIKMKPEKFKNRLNINTTANIDEDGSISAESILEYTGYLAVRERNNVDNIEDNEKMQEHLKSILEDFNLESEIDTFYYENQDSLTKPLILTLKYTLKDAAEINENIMYLTPPFISGRQKNPFVRDTRNFSIDYSYTYRESEKLFINYPKGFVLSDRPKETKKKIKGFNYSKIFLSSDNYLECRRSFEIGKKEFTTNQYPQLKEAYDAAVASDQELIVLEKKK